MADVAAAVLAAPAEHDGRTYDVTGGEGMTLDEAAAILSETAGREVVYERETLEQRRESRRASGAPDWEIEGWVTSYAALPAGDLEPPSDTVAADPRPPAPLARGRTVRAPRAAGPPATVNRIEATNDAGYAAPIGLAADPVVFTLLEGRLSVLLARRLEEPQRGMFALPGGFVGAAESPEQTAERKLREKTGVGSVHLEQLRTYAAPGPRPARVAAVDRLPRARAPRAPCPTRRGRPTATRAGICSTPCPSSRSTTRGSSTTGSGACAPGSPTRPGSCASAAGCSRRSSRSGQAQRLYEAIAGESLDPANFRRDVKATGLLVDTGGRRSEGPGAPRRPLPARPLSAAADEKVRPLTPKSGL